MEQHEIIIIGGGPAGLAAAAAAHQAGTRDILILERERELGGILNQCIHNGFGLHTFGEELTGPEYADRYVKQVQKLGICCLTDTSVIDINREKEITAIGRKIGLVRLRAETVILAMGCRERPRGALNIPGFRPAGIYSAGTAQRLMNIEGYRVGREVVILGSGDIGLIMARRMTLEGAKVRAVVELMPYSGGLKRNLVQCLEDYGIPLKLSHTVVCIHGKERVTGVTVAAVDEEKHPVPGTEEYYVCDTLLLSVGLLPENELTRLLEVPMDPATSGPVVNERLETGLPGVFACGNVLHVHDLVDYVSEEAARAGEAAARWIKNSQQRQNLPLVPLRALNGVRYTVPQYLDIESMPEEAVIRFRVGDVYRNRFISVYRDGERIWHRRRPVLAPGEMEQVHFKKTDLAGHGPVKEIIVCTEED